MSGYFPRINDDVNQQKVIFNIFTKPGPYSENTRISARQFLMIYFVQDGYNKCFEGDVVEVGNLEKMEKNENGIRWFETQSSENCRFTNTVRELGKWTEDFKTNGK